jgi:hypothetical protein
MRWKVMAPARDDNTNTLRIDHFQNRPAAGLITVIAQRHFEPELHVVKQLACVDVVKDVPDRHAEPSLAKVAPDAMGRRVWRTCGYDADFAWHRAKDGSIGVERDELFAGDGGAKPGADDGPRPPQFAVFVAPRVLPLLTLTRSGDGLGLRRGRRERERAGQQQCPEDSCGRHDLHHIGRSLGPAIGLTAGSTEIGAETREELSIEETAKTDIMPTNQHA